MAHEHTIQHAAFFDKILGQIELGQTHDAIMHLVGMLDASCWQPTSRQSARTELNVHMLNDLLLQHPACLQAQFSPGDPKLIELLLTPDLPIETSPTGRRLFTVISQLSIVKAVRAQRTMCAQIIQRALEQGKRVAVVGNEAIFDELEISDYHHWQIHRYDHAGFCAAPTEPFDLVMAQLLPEPFQAFFKHLPNRLTETGCAHFATRIPGHLGTGWLAILLGFEPANLGEKELNSLVAEAGLKITSFRDATDCLIWSEASHKQPHLTRPRGKKDGLHRCAH